MLEIYPAGLFKINFHRPSFDQAIDFPEHVIHFNTSLILPFDMNFVSSALRKLTELVGRLKNILAKKRSAAVTAQVFSSRSRITLLLNKESLQILSSFIF